MLESNDIFAKDHCQYARLAKPAVTRPVGHVGAASISGRTLAASHRLRALTSVAACALLCSAAPVLATGDNNPAPTGAILDLAGGQTGTAPQAVNHGAPVRESVTFTANLTNTDITFAFRDDPSFFNVSNITLVNNTVPGGNLITNGDFSGGTTTSNGNAQAAVGWTFDNVYGAYATGVVTSCSGFAGTSNCWYDGAVQAYDAIDQVVHTTVGDSYTLSFYYTENGGLTTFSELSTNGNTTDTGGNGIDILVYAGAGLPPAGGANAIFAVNNGAPKNYSSNLVQNGGSLENDFEGGTLRISSSGTITGPFRVGNVAGNTIDAYGHSVNFTGGFTGTGGLTIASTGGGGLVTFSNSGGSRYTGMTYVQDTTLQAGAANAFSPNSAVSMANSASALLNLNNFNQTIGGLSGGGAAGGNVALGSATLTVKNGGVYSGVISGGGGIVVNSGLLVLTNANTYAGGANVVAGTLGIGDSHALGSGALTLAAGATLQAAANTLAPGNAVTLNGAATIDTQANSLAMTGVVSGAGALRKAGSGALLLANANSYAGGTTLAAGTLAVGNSQALGAGALTLAAGVTLQAAANALTLANVVTLNGAATVDTQANAFALSGAISGAGSLNKIGSGALLLANANTFTGGTTLAAGTLAVGNSQALGAGALTMAADTRLQFAAADLNIANGVTFAGQPTGVHTIDTGANNATISGAISGSGALAKTGAGALTLSGADSYGGATEVKAGALAVNGSITSSVQVDSGAALGGSGSVGGIVALRGALVEPGMATPYSTLSSTGDVTFSNGSSFVVAVNGAGRSDRLATTGSAALNGAAVQARLTTGFYSPLTSSTLISATGGVTGTFSSVSTSMNFAFLSPYLTYDAHDVFLRFRQTATFASVARTPNQFATATALQQQPIGSPLYNAVIGQTVAGARAGFNALSGEIHASAVSAAFDDSRLPREAVLDRLADPFGAPPSSSAGFVASTAPAADPFSSNATTAWGQGFGTLGHLSGDGDAASLDRRLTGFIAGIDESLDNRYRAGLAGGYSQSNLHAPARSSVGSITSAFVGLYGGATFDALRLRGGALHAFNRFQTNRTAAFPGFSETEGSAYDGGASQIFGEAAYRLALPNDFASGFVEPFVGAMGESIQTSAFAEHGGAAALTGVSRAYEFGATTLGARYEIGLADDSPITARGLFGWRHVFGDVTPTSVLAFASAPSTQFSITGAPIASDAAMVEAGLAWNLYNRLSFGMSYSGALSAHGADNGVKGRMETWF